MSCASRKKGPDRFLAGKIDTRFESIEQYSMDAGPLLRFCLALCVRSATLSASRPVLCLAQALKHLSNEPWYRAAHLVSDHSV